MTTKIKHSKQFNENLAYKKSVFLEQLKKSGGKLEPVHKATRIGRAVYMIWLNEDPEFAEVAKAIRFEHCNIAEDVVIKNVKRGNLNAAEFVLTHRHPEYKPVQRVEVSGIATAEDIE